MTERWFRTPGGIMRQLEPWAARPGQEPGHWYIDRDQHFHAYRDRAVKATRAPTWFRRESIGERLYEARRQARRMA